MRFFDNHISMNWKSYQLINSDFADSLFFSFSSIFFMSFCLVFGETKMKSNADGKKGIAYTLRYSILEINTEQEKREECKFWHLYASIWSVLIEFHSFWLCEHHTMRYTSHVVGLNRLYNHSGRSKSCSLMSKFKVIGDQETQTVSERDAHKIILSITVE